MENTTQISAAVMDCIDLKEPDISSLENCLSNGCRSFIEKCSSSLSGNISNYSSDEIKNFLYIFKFLYDEWSVTNRVVRTIKKEILQALFLLLLSIKEVKNRNLIINKIVTSIESHWHFSGSEFPFLDEEERQRIISLYGIFNREDIESRFTDLNFLEKISSNEILQLFPDIIEGLKNAFSNFRHHIDIYDPEDGFLIKSIFAGIIDPAIQNKYPGITIVLPISCLLNKIDAINDKTFKISSKVITDKHISFNDSDPCYITERVYIRSDFEKYRPLPDWAIWFFKAGEKMASLGTEKKNIVLGFSLPTKIYAALFFLLGYETWTAIQSMKCEDTDYEHFLRITGSKRKAPLLIWDNDRWKRCYAKGVETVCGQEMFSVSVPGTENKRHQRLIPKVHLHLFREAVHPERKVGDHQVGYAMRGFDFYRSYYKKPDEVLLKYLITKKSKYTVVGNKTNFKNEIDELPINVVTPKGWSEGSIMDIIRLNNFLFSEYDLSRGVILSPEAINEYNSHSDLVVFDGTLPFLKHFDEVEGNTKVIFLDRSEPQFPEACRVIMEQNYSDRENEEDIVLYNSMPETIETIMFEE